ncbi:MAG: ABC transporter permease [Acidimicrobiales bacterium]
MRFVPYAIAGAVVVFVLVRRWRGRPRGHGARRSFSTLSRGWAGRRGPLGDTGLVAAREIRERLRGRLFKVVTLLLLAVVAAAIVIPTVHSSSSPRAIEIGVVGTLAGPVRHAVVVAAKDQGPTVRFVTEPDAAAARSRLRKGQITLVVVGSASVLVETLGALSNGTTTGRAARSVASALGVERAFTAAGLSPAQATTVAHAKPVPVHGLERGARKGAVTATLVVGLVLIFVLLTQYLTWTLMGVMEEKTSRVVEVLLATVRPVQLLGGKVLGIGLVAFLQAAIVIAVALVLAAAVGSTLLDGTTPLFLGATLVWLLIGYAFYSWVFAAAGSMAARQAQVQSLSLPLSIPIMAGYIVGLTSAGPAAPSLLVTVFAYLPPTAPFGMPVLVAHGSATWWEFLLSALVSVGCTVGVARLASGIYRRAVLQTGRRLTVRQLLS